MVTRCPRFQTEIVTGLTILLTGVCLLWWDVPRLNTTWVLFAWCGWLVVLDGIIGLRGRPSFLCDRPREALALLAWSVPFWTMYEWYNLRLQNWTYVFLPRGEVAQALFATLAFATVLPACFLHAELWGPLRWRWRPLPVHPGLQALLALFGAACLVLPLLWPARCFWMVWGAGLFLPDLLCYRLGAPSLLGDLERGQPDRLLRLLAGGLLAGGVWESLNFWARAKWVYTVPGFEELKLFEMPLLGFAGFPLLALEGAATYGLVCWWARAGRTWERPDVGQPAVSGRHWRRAIVLWTLFSFGADRLPLQPAVGSLRPLLSELRGLSPGDIEALKRAGITTPERLVHAGGRPEEIAAQGWETALRHASLALHKGMGPAAAAGLLDCGVDLGGLFGAAPEVLHGCLQRTLAEPPRLALVRVWVRAAGPDGGARR